MSLVSEKTQKVTITISGQTYSLDVDENKIDLVHQAAAYIEFKKKWSFQQTQGTGWRSQAIRYGLVRGGRCFICIMPISSSPKVGISIDRIQAMNAKVTQLLAEYTE